LSLFVLVHATATAPIARLSLHAALPIYGLIAMGRGPELPVVIAATMFTGAMTELAQQWADGRLGQDLDAVVDHAVALSLAMHARSEEHTSELQSRENLVCRLLLEKKKMP